MSYAEGSLLRGSDATIYVIEGGARRLVPSPAIFEANGYRAEMLQNVQGVAYSYLAAIPLGQPLALPELSGTPLANASAYREHRLAAASTAVQRRRASPAPDVTALVAARRRELQGQIDAARADIATRQAEAEGHRKDAQDDLAAVQGQQQGFRDQMAQQHVLVLSHTARIKEHDAQMASMDRGKPALISYGVPPDGVFGVLSWIVNRGWPEYTATGYQKHGKTYLNFVFRRSSAGQHDTAWSLDAAAAQQLIDGQTPYRNQLLRLSSYLDGGQVRYIVSSVLYGGVDSAGYLEAPAGEVSGRNAALVAQGYGMVSQSFVQRPDGSVVGCALFARAAAGKTASATLVTADEYQRLVDQYAAQRMLPTHLDVVEANGEPRFSAVFSPATYEDYGARHHLSSKELREEHERRMAQGQLPTALVGYSNGDKAHYAAVWVREPAAPHEERDSRLTRRRSAGA